MIIFGKKNRCLICSAHLIKYQSFCKILDFKVTQIKVFLAIFSFFISRKGIYNLHDLSERKAAVQVGVSISEPFDQELGCVQEISASIIQSTNEQYL
jgi:hypothetical protein